MLSCPGPGIVHTLPGLQGRHEISNNSQHSTRLNSTTRLTRYSNSIHIQPVQNCILEISFNSPELSGHPVLSVSPQCCCCMSYSSGILEMIYRGDVTLQGTLYLYFVITLRGAGVEQWSSTQQLGADITNNLRFQSYCGLKPELSINIMITSFYTTSRLFSSFQH